MADAVTDNVVTLNREASSCKIHLFGATIISWTCRGQELLFVSSKSHFDNKKAIRGGIPLVFPNFGPWEAGPQHGFARINLWKLEKEASQNEAEKTTTAVFALEDNEETRKLWDFKFKLLYKVCLGGNTLKTSFVVQNTGAATMSFTCLLHTYCKVPDVTKISVSGLKGVTYIDTVKADKPEAVDDSDAITINGRTDRVYKATPDEHVVTGGAGSGKLTISKCCLPDTVVWNPWKEKAAAMSDFGDEEYINMICVEAGYVVEPKQLAAGQTYECCQTLTSNL